QIGEYHPRCVRANLGRAEKLDGATGEGNLCLGIAPCQGHRLGETLRRLVEGMPSALHPDAGLLRATEHDNAIDLARQIRAREALFQRQHQPVADRQPPAKQQQAGAGSDQTATHPVAAGLQQSGAHEQQEEQEPGRLGEEPEGLCKVEEHAPPPSGIDAVRPGDRQAFGAAASAGAPTPPPGCAWRRTGSLTDGRGPQVPFAGAIHWRNSLAQFTGAIHWRNPLAEFLWRSQQEDSEPRLARPLVVRLILWAGQWAPMRRSLIQVRVPRCLRYPCERPPRGARPVATGAAPCRLSRWRRASGVRDRSSRSRTAGSPDQTHGSTARNGNGSAASGAPNSRRTAIWWRRWWRPSRRWGCGIGWRTR